MSDSERPTTPSSPAAKRKSGEHRFDLTTMKPRHPVTELAKVWGVKLEELDAIEHALKLFGVLDPGPVELLVLWLVRREFNR